MSVLFRDTKDACLATVWIETIESFHLALVTFSIFRPFELNKIDPAFITLTSVDVK